MQPAQPVDAFLQQTYPGLYAKGTHTVVKPGDKIAVAGLDWRIVTAAGEVLKTPMAGAGKPNPYCAAATPNPDEGGVENSMSVGSVIAFGKFRMVHLGDLTQKIEVKLMCPNNPIGVADLWVVSHHGQPMSNGQMLVHAIQPRVAILNNGTRKGGQPDAMKVVFSSPRLEDLWQLHFSLLSGQESRRPACSSPTRSMNNHRRCRSRRWQRRRLDRGRRRRRCTTARRTGSRCRRRLTARLR